MIASDPQGNIYVADYGNDRIEKFDPDGKFLAQWGGSSSLGVRFSQPWGLAVDSQANFYVTEFGAKRVRKIHMPG